MTPLGKIEFPEEILASVMAVREMNPFKFKVVF